MLIDDTEAKSKAKQLEKISSDARFDTIIAKDRKYAIDPTHKEYRKIANLIEAVYANPPEN